MKRLALTAALACAVLAPNAGAATHRPVCHWTHHRSGAVNVYVQVCKVTRQRKHKTSSRWTTAGPGQYPAPRIG